ncbi:MAG: hypothetical protein A3J29_17665 [Acidobacteria bacterium RIFCSPLOWO2_12_FULL_67_14b]|nr:MAG: hypothetical protein A3J29_17665 [Acidobacteria bacterium RIFCSPLOWO2_12_FULL_67_14b]
MHPSLAHLDHRPWPVPGRPWIGRQSWCDLLFAHWPVPVASVRHLVPAGLEVDSFDRQTWIGVVPFRMEGVMVRGLPDVPWISAFPELNVRLYVTRGGKPGVWFLSLDASNPVAVWVARRVFHLPYEHARMKVDLSQAGVEYWSARRRPPAAFEATFRPTSPVREPARGSLEHWLTERYCFYALDGRGRLLRGDVHHRAWPLQSAEAEIRRNAMLEVHGVSIHDAKPLLHFARRLDMVAWAPTRVGRAAH